VRYSFRRLVRIYRLITYRDVFCHYVSIVVYGSSHSLYFFLKIFLNFSSMSANFFRACLRFRNRRVALASSALASSASFSGLLKNSQARLDLMVTSNYALPPTGRLVFWALACWRA
jgi:hypothetical protein